MPRTRCLGVALMLAGACLAQAQSPWAFEAPPEAIPLPVDEEVTAPVPSPDGAYLAFTRTDSRGLLLLDLATGAVRVLSEARGAGFRPAWSPSGRSIAFRTSTGGPRPRLQVVVAHPDGAAEIASPLLRDLSLPFWTGEQLGYVRLDRSEPVLVSLGPDPLIAHGPVPVTLPEGTLLRLGAGPGIQTASQADGKVFFLPRRSEDGSRFVVECLDGHLYLGRSAGGELEDLGPGSYPSFVRGDTAILLERTADDGVRLTAGELYLLDLATGALTALASTPDRIERRPAMAGDGKTVFFEEGGRIWKGVLP